MQRISLLIAAIGCAASAALGQEAAPPFTFRGKTAVVRAAGITEASGAAASRRADDAVWVINDSGHTPQLHLLGTDGSDRGSVTVEGVKNTDWEDLASYTSGGVARLLIADTGDNNARRPHVSLLIVREPAIPAGGKPVAGSVKVERRIDFRFEGGPRDCEAVAVDVANQRVLLLTKRTSPPELHELPLTPKTAGGTLPVTRKIGTVTLPPPTRLRLALATQPTAMDISADGAAVVVLTYFGVFLFPRAEGQSWQAAMAAPVALGPHLLPQAEAIAFSRDGSSIFVLSEGKKQPLMTYERNR